jgi:hypothetical protein
MWRSVRAAIAGVIIGLIGGFVFVGVSTINKIYKSDTYKESAINAINMTSVAELESQLQALGYDKDQLVSSVGYDSEAIQVSNILSEYDNTDFENVISEQEDIVDTATETNKVIRIKTDYTGTEHLTANEIVSLEAYVNQALLYGIAEKLGEDYNNKDISEVRRQLILSLEYINSCVEESAEEWGININSSSRFDYVYMPEAVINGETYEAGYYETLCVSLDDM